MLSHSLTCRKQTFPFSELGGYNGPEMTEAWEGGFWSWGKSRTVLGLAQATPNMQLDEVAETVCYILKRWSCSPMLPFSLCFSLFPPSCRGCDIKSPSALPLVLTHVIPFDSLIQQKVLHFFFFFLLGCISARSLSWSNLVMDWRGSRRSTGEW